MSSPRRPTCRPGGTATLRTDQSRVLGRYDRVGAGWKRGPGHDSHGGAGTHFAGVRLARQHLPDDGEFKRRVFGRTGRERAVQRVAVHRGAIECGNVERRDHLLREHAIGCGVDGHTLVGEAIRVRVDPRERRADLRTSGEPVHAHVLRNGSV